MAEIVPQFHPLWKAGGNIGDACRGAIGEAEKLLDIGPGIRPYPFEGPCLRAEPHPNYAEKLEAAGHMVLRASAIQVLPLVGKSFDTIFMLDVIEHMTREEGKSVIEMAVERGRVVIFTPLGFMKQDGKDPWEMDGDYWQTHKSGWTPDDFPGWYHFVNKAFHGYMGAFVAINR